MIIGLINHQNTIKMILGAVSAHFNDLQVPPVILDLPWGTHFTPKCIKLCTKLFGN